MLTCLTKSLTNLRVPKPCQLRDGLLVELEEELPVVALEAVEGALLQHEDGGRLLCRLLEAAVHLPYEAWM